MINATTDVLSAFTVPTSTGEPLGITTGPDGNLWFTESTIDPKTMNPENGEIAVFNPATHVVVEFPIPTSGGDPLGIIAGPGQNLWFTEGGTGAIGQVALDGVQITIMVPVSQAPSPPPAPGFFTYSTTAPAATGIIAVGQSRKGLTSITIAFNEALAPGSASETALYSVLGAVKKRGKTAYTKHVAVKSVTYNNSTRSVTITLAKPYKGAVQVTVKAGLTAANGPSSSSTQTFTAG
jgi:hypothetical protein